MPEDDNNPPFLHPEQYGEVLIDLTKDRGRFMLGAHPWQFETKWSTAEVDGVHIYDDPANIKAVAIDKTAKSIDRVGVSNFSQADFTSRAVTPRDLTMRARVAYRGQIVLLENENGYRAVVQIVLIRTSKDPVEMFLQFRFAIDTERGVDFSRFVEEVFEDKELYDTVSKVDRDQIQAEAIVGNADSTIEVESKEWTGESSIQQSAQLAASLVPGALEATAILIEKYELPRHNGGPPLDIDAKALESLKQLHAALGELIESAGADNMLDRFPGLIKGALDWANQFKKDVKHDPFPFATSSIILAVCLAIDSAATGGFASAAALTYGRRSKE